MPGGGGICCICCCICCICCCICGGMPGGKPYGLFCMVLVAADTQAHSQYRAKCWYTT